MTYYLVRIIICFVLFLAIILFNLIKKTFALKNAIGIFVLLFVSCYFSFYIPITAEYFFMKYSSIEDAFSYGHNVNSLIKVVQKDDMAVVIYTEDNKSISFIPMSQKEGKWKIDPLSAFHYQFKYYKTTYIYEITFPIQTHTFIFDRL